MERDANYAAVGAFILLVIAMAIGFLLWYSDANDGREYDLYEVYFAGSVSGLNRGSPVRYLGVDVGRVRRLSVDRENPTQVIVIAEIDETAPISAATRASLGLQGVTGLLFINLKEAADADRNAPLKQGKRYPLIDSVASDFDVFLSSLPEVMGRAVALLGRIEQVLSDDNIAGISAAINDVRSATATLPRTSARVTQLVEQLNATVDEVHTAAASVRTLTEDAQPEVKAALARVSATADHLAQAASRIDGFTQRSEGQLGHFTEQGLFELERLMRETRSAAFEFRELSRSLKENPSQILYEPPPSGMEIER